MFLIYWEHARAAETLGAHKYTHGPSTEVSSAGGAGKYLKFLHLDVQISECFQNMAMLLYLDSCSLICGMRTTLTSAEAFMMDYRVLE